MMAANGEVIQPSKSGIENVPADALSALPLGMTGGLFDDAAALGSQEMADEIVATAVAEGIKPKAVAPKALKAPSNTAEVIEAFGEVGIRAISRNAALKMPMRFITEVKPVFEAMSLDVQSAVQLLPLEVTLESNAIKAALNRMTEREIYTELFTGQTHEEDVQVMTDADSLMDITLDKLQGIGLEEQGAQDAIAAMAQRLSGAVEQAWALQEDAARPPEGLLRSKARQAACWVIHKRFREFEELLHAQWANKAKEQDAQMLPDALLIPANVVVLPAKKNSYGIMFPEKGRVTAARDAMGLAARSWYEGREFTFASEIVCVATMDATYELNEGETKFAKALERAEFVHWWHRNPQGKPFSVGLMRADSEKMFYPDFIVCMEHVMGEAPMMRLVDPKHDTKDASRKSKHVSRFYGRVLFLTEDNDRFKIVNDDGSVGAVVDYDDLALLKDWMRSSPPLGQ
jgi:type III restriction enzyme